MKLGSQLLAALMACVFAVSSASAEIEMLQWQRPRRAEHVEAGGFNKLLAVLLAEINMPVSVNFMPVQRIRRAMLGGHSVCVAPAALPAFLRKNPSVAKENYIASSRIDMATGHVFSRPGEEPVHRLADLAGKTVAYWWRVPLVAQLKATGVNLQYLLSEKEAIQMMMAGRVDLAWGWRPDSLAYHAEITGKPANFDPEFSISQLAMQIICKKTEETRSLLAQVDKHLAAMRSDGRLRKLLGPHAVIYGVDIPFPK